MPTDSRDSNAKAQLLASLNHSNIAAIYGFEQAGDTQALVLELVEGDTVADRIALPTHFELRPSTFQFHRGTRAFHRR
jgi:hypothetical protein